MPINVNSNSDVLNDIRSIGMELDSQWRSMNYSTKLFPALASASLARARLCSISNIPHIAASLIVDTADVHSHSFSDLSLRVFNSHHFFIELLIWLDGSTTIHEHAFCGAFCVLDGSSIHSKFQFDCRHRISDRMLIGKSHFCGSELLSRGDIRQICPGKGNMHSLFHLARPSLTMVIRTHAEKKYLPQMEIRHPCFAIESQLPRDSSDFGNDQRTGSFAFKN